MKTSILKPGLLVSLKTNLRGGVNYRRIDLEPDHLQDEGRRARWETTRDIPNAAEYEAAVIARGKARALVAAVCCASSFGLLCPVAREAELQAAIADASGIAEAHNAGAALSRVSVFVLIGRIAQDDAEAARAIASEIRELLDLMRSGIAAADPQAIREAAGKARALSGMLSLDVAGKVSAAIVEARKAAREITARVSKAGEAAAVVVAECNVSAIDAARFGVLDLDAGEVEREAPAGRELDLPPVAVPGSLVAESFGLPFALEL